MKKKTIETFLESPCFQLIKVSYFFFSSLSKDLFVHVIFLLKKNTFLLIMHHDRGVTKRCRQALLTNSALVIRVPMGGKGRGVAWSQPMSTAVHIT
jgi:hypothetical protein